MRAPNLFHFGLRGSVTAARGDSLFTLGKRAWPGLDCSGGVIRTLAAVWQAKSTGSVCGRPPIRVPTYGSTLKLPLAARMLIATKLSRRCMSVTPQIGATSPVNRFKKLDGRTREAKRLAQIKRDLTEEAGGEGRVSAAAKYLIERVSIDILRLELFD